MAKKGQTTKKEKNAVSVDTNAISVHTNASFPDQKQVFGVIGELRTTEPVYSGVVTTIKRKPIETMTLEDVIYLEKACSLICKKYETTARLDMENNRKLTEFTSYYRTIIDELETRVKRSCTIPD
jgi:hypothetical protein